MCQMTSAQIRMPLHPECQAWTKCMEKKWRKFLHICIYFVFGVVASLAPVYFRGATLKLKGILKVWFPYVSAIWQFLWNHGSSAPGFCVPGEFYPLHIFLYQCMRSHIQGQMTGAMRKGKWKPLTCKILRGAISIDRKHHNITFPVCDPRLGELSVLAEDK